MYNLLVGLLDGVAHANRMFEYTDDSARAFVAPRGTPDSSLLMGCLVW